MQSFKVQDFWTTDHTCAFLELKAAISSEPVLHGPRWDGTPFIVTTDGCKDGFAGVLTQRSTTLLPSGRTVVKLHPLAFASKRTSSSEEKYMPFLLEFATLKFALDKFGDIIGHFPVEIETDCQALQDVLLSDKLNSAHACWWDGILAYHIVDVRHVPVPGDGSEWTVNEDWEATAGFADTLLLTLDDPGVSTLRARFSEEPLFLEVVDAPSMIR
ncbi:hypothetical protein EWM64_g10875 [Hericium alpestre]|uniref:Reverse transcriptase/retrotransposon-derived protein RNase H-like domain-containing protein n=1 Tax=Hericium alpestre TaxID=135208 RepID=A0A4Y9ZGH7_9AGAM|nr:hypothetical protein EWM64_g10875 [Hericium alpestre]